MYGCVLALIISCLHYFEFHQKFFATPAASVITPQLEAADAHDATAVYSENQIQKP